MTAEGNDVAAGLFQVGAFLDKIDPVSIVWGIILEKLCEEEPDEERERRDFSLLPSLFVKKMERMISDPYSPLPPPIKPSKVLKGRKEFLKFLKEVYEWGQLVVGESKTIRKSQALQCLKEASSLYREAGKVPAQNVCWVLSEWLEAW